MPGLSDALAGGIDFAARDSKPYRFTAETSLAVLAILEASGIKPCATMWGAKVGGLRPNSVAFYSFRTSKGGKSDIHTVRYQPVLTEDDAREIVGRYTHGTTRDR